MEQKLSPISGKDRLETIDMLRGFALLGIIIANIAWYLYPAYLQQDPSFKNEWTSFWSPFDYAVLSVLDMFVVGKFVMLFSMLFGFGMVIMQERTGVKQLNFWGIYSRRLIALLIFGSIHAYFIWFGDILTDYAILGFLLLLMHKLKPKTLLIISITLYSLLIILITLGSLSTDSSAMLTQLSEEDQKLIESTIEAHQTGNIQQLIETNIEERTYYTMRNGLYALYSGMPLAYLFSNLPFLLVFMFGAAIAKNKWVHHFKQHRKGFFITWLITLLTGGTLNWALPFIVEKQYAVQTIQYVSSPLITIFYAISLLFIYHTIKGKKILHWFTFPGRMAFTNYISQSIICTFLFGPFAFGVYGKLHLTTAIWIAIAIYAFQLFFSKWWLTKFRFGPLEYIWRTITYWGIRR
ncbi:DUF418 domain-containing protein [Lysinibacillus sp. KU-BSD001]|uniref:DUF418 domain-containing protein n=1 Tax=Lysinibacillus sp. KU-BSD001 TaxID=3141328 RepID=UPI0036E02F68